MSTWGEKLLGSSSAEVLVWVSVTVPPPCTKDSLRRKEHILPSWQGVFWLPDLPVTQLFFGGESLNSALLCFSGNPCQSCLRSERQARPVPERHRQLAACFPPQIYGASCVPPVCLLSALRMQISWSKPNHPQFKGCIDFKAPHEEEGELSAEGAFPPSPTGTICIEPWFRCHGGQGWPK